MKKSSHLVVIQSQYDVAHENGFFFRMKMKVWRKMEMEPIFAHRGEMTLGWILIIIGKKEKIKHRQPFMREYEKDTQLFH